MKRSILLLVLLIVLFAGAEGTRAYQAPTTYYVDTAYDGPEDGLTETTPYDTTLEADAVAQTKPGGGVILVKKNGVYVFDHFTPYVRPGQTGIPLAGPILYGLLAGLSLLLILAGWFFGRRSRQLQHSS